MNQQRTIMGALDYSIASLKNIKTTLMDLGHTQKELNWAVGGIIITLTSQLIRVCQDTFAEAAQTDEANCVPSSKGFKIILFAITLLRDIFSKGEFRRIELQHFQIPPKRIYR